MNKHLLLAGLFSVFSGAASAQQIKPSQFAGNGDHSQNFQSISATQGLLSTTPTAAASGDRAACTDKVTYTTYHHNGAQKLEVYLGGNDGWVAALQSFPGFTGELISVEFRGKTQKASGSSTMQMGVYSIHQSTYLPNALLGGGTTTITSENTYTITFSSPISVTNGFCLGFETVTGDSCIIYTNGNGSAPTPGYSIVYHPDQGLNKLSAASYNVDYLVSPTIRFNYSDPSLSVSGPTTICGGTQVSATLTPPTSMNHFSHPVFNPNGQAHAINFGDGSAAYTSTSANHTYHNAGSYTISASSTYRGWNSNCTSNAPSSVNMTVNPATTSFFSWQANGLFVQFNNLSTHATGYTWIFGDGGSTSSAASPVRTYTSDGTYTVELAANGQCGSDLYYSNITIAQGQNGGDVSVTEEGAALHLNIFPNPTTDRLQLAFELSKATNLNVDLMNPSGQLISSQQQNAALKGKFDFDLSGLAAGVYFVRISYDNEVIVKPVSKL